MARSGTSLAASIFASHGYYVDEETNIAPKDHLNPRGYWESLSLKKFNEKILRATGFEYDNTWINKGISDEQVDYIDQYTLGNEYIEFLNSFEKSAPWVWKDPRLCYTLGCWWPLLDASSVVVLLIRRNSKAIYNSFVRTGWRKIGISERKATFKRIDAHIANAKKLIELHEIPVIEIQYEDFKKDPSAIANKINRVCGLNLTPAELGYDKRFNHYKLSGMFSTILDKVVDMLPSTWIKTIKRLVPRFILVKLYPERYEQ